MTPDPIPGSGIAVPTLRKFVCWLMIAIVPASLMAADTGAAMLHAGGDVSLNGGAVPGSSAVFPGDIVETKANSVASITVSGSEVSILANSLVRFDGDLVVLEHGSVTMTTSQGMRVRAGCIVMSPAANDWTEYDVADVNGTVHIAAHKLDVNINEESTTAQAQPTQAKPAAAKQATLPQGQETTRDEHCKKGAGAYPAANGNILDSMYVKAAGGALLGGLLIWLLLPGDNPPSPSKP